MNSDFLSHQYFQRQLERVRRMCDTIRSRSVVAFSGREIPEDGAMPIGIGRQLEAAVLFLDICGFSARPNDTRADQERLLRTVTLFFSEMIRIVEDYEGVVEKNTGDGLMAYFSGTGSNSVTTPQQRAVAAALTMFHANAALINPVLTRSNLGAIDFRITIDFGTITIAEVGAARGFHGIVAVGTPANIASKLLSKAGRNSLLIGQRVVFGLPALWITNFVRLTTIESGWVYTMNGQPYPVYEYDGRWTRPLP